VWEWLSYFIVAEIMLTIPGMHLAVRLIEAAAWCDAVKLQTICADESYVPGELSYTIFAIYGLTRTISTLAAAAVQIK
jgi:hypothetical protein